MKQISNCYEQLKDALFKNGISFNKFSNNLVVYNTVKAFLYVAPILTFTQIPDFQNQKTTLTTNILKWMKIIELAIKMKTKALAIVNSCLNTCTN